MMSDTYKPTLARANMCTIVSSRTMFRITISAHDFIICDIEMAMNAARHTVMTIWLPMTYNGMTSLLCEDSIKKEDSSTLK